MTIQEPTFSVSSPVLIIEVLKVRGGSSSPVHYSFYYHSKRLCYTMSHLLGHHVGILHFPFSIGQSSSNLKFFSYYGYGLKYPLLWSAWAQCAVACWGHPSAYYNLFCHLSPVWRSFSNSRTEGKIRDVIFPQFLSTPPNFAVQQIIQPNSNFALHPHSNSRYVS